MRQLLSGINKENGILTLMSVLLIGAIGLVVGVSLILMGLANSKTSLAVVQEDQAKALANACAEQALQQLFNSSNDYTAGSLTLGQGTCSYTVTNTGGDTRKITATGTVGTVIRKDQITTNGFSPMVISSWQEVSDFK
jgi:hypothetical protein